MDEQILEAARDCLLSGAARITLADVARRAGVSRPTIYRRWQDVNDLVRDMITREVAGLLEQVGPGDGRRADLVRRIVAFARAAHEDQLLRVLLDERRELLATYVFQRIGTSQRSVLKVLREEIEQSQRLGEVREGDPEELAMMTLVLAQSVTQSTRLLEPVLHERWADELARVLNGYLQP
ncbi:TetR/AcrR family transcriptional regulator [Segniliparus rugosus]|uniref:HTH tetR-type domain-containing protein n=1 Tax=Segniliparus rugosus (strain ATCC BAA-974 / DSM 45345 / CCUG 50838 / CIP 108380 / JCM 13579 / CDC 945) TaxID=679197 RepID=E5XUQ0_SEGRC|nr:TetR/AcrR family transcriptional regulator [Segniliparus rugosus]EFV11888.1 hypothetical protein HMPREF9336_03222 [Segniliparus rugosus ATCC BAA-974]